MSGDTGVALKLKRWVYSWIGEEISRVTRYYDRVLEWPRTRGEHELLSDFIDCGEKQRLATPRDLDAIAFPEDGRTAVVMNGTLNSCEDVQGLLETVSSRLNAESRLVLVLYNPYLSGLYRLADRTGLRSGPETTTFLTRSDLESLCRLSGLEVVRMRPSAYSPFRLLGLGSLLNRVLPAVPLLRHLSFVTVAYLRPAPRPRRASPLVSAVIPARNERGNIAAAIERLRGFDSPLEVLFVEGGSSDGTWEEIESVARQPSPPFPIRALRQDGTGKANAVLTGFAEARGELLTILDADLTVPPEDLVRFRDAWVRGTAEFVNGSRLLYPMEREAMRPLNLAGNAFFARMLSIVLGLPISDSLCGTKLLSRRDWERIRAWNRDFGKFDPFGDFELLFGAANLAFSFVNLPVRYRARTYGETNISRFRDGFLLLRMTLVGLLRLQFATAPRRRRSAG